jgi:single-stranded DNA-binding protein
LARVEGEARMTSYENRDGETKYNLELTAREVMFLDKRKQEETTHESIEEDLPF